MRLRTNPLFFLLVILSLTLFICSVSVLTVSVSIAETDSIEQKRDSGKDKKVSFNFIDVDISTVVKFISEVTGKNFIFDEKVKGPVTIITPSKLSLDDAFSLFTSVLELKGFTIVQSGKIYKIVPVSQAKQSSTQLIKDDKVPMSDEYITRLIPLTAISSVNALNFLQPLISRDGHISSFGPSNMLMVVDSAMNIEKIIDILEAIDKPGVEEPELIFLKYANAEDVVRIITEALKINSTAQPKAVGIPRPGGIVGSVSVEEAKTSVFADVRLNAIIILADKQQRDAIKSMILLLDIPLPEATSKINVYFLEYADATELSKVLENIITGISTQAKAVIQPTKSPFEPGGKITITPDKATNSLVIVASPADYQSILQVIKQLDKKRKQVYVEAMIVEASIDRLQDIGSKWRLIAEKDGEPIAVGGFGTVDATAMQDILFGLTGLTGGGMGNFLDVPITTINTDGTVVTSTLSVPGFAALFSLNEFKGAVNVLSTPQILTSDNQEAEIIVGENVPFISKKESDPSRPQSVFSTIERKDVGITLRLTPQITEGDYVKLDIYQEISALKQESTTVVLTVGPTTTKRSTKTSVVVKDKQTVVIGGLMEEREEENVTKVPLLGDIPLLGWLFKNKSVDKKKTNLLVFLTPHIVKEADHLSNLTNNKKAEFARSEEMYNHGELLIKFREGTSEEKILEIFSSEDASIISTLKSRELYLIKLKQGQDVKEAMKVFTSYQEVEYSEPNYILRIQGR